MLWLGLHEPLLDPGGCCGAAGAAGAAAQSSNRIPPSSRSSIHAPLSRSEDEDQAVCGCGRPPGAAAVLLSGPGSR